MKKVGLTQKHNFMTGKTGHLEHYRAWCLSGLWVQFFRVSGFKGFRVQVLGCLVFFGGVPGFTV